MVDTWRKWAWHRLSWVFQAGQGCTGHRWCPGPLAGCGSHCRKTPGTTNCCSDSQFNRVYAGTSLVPKWNHLPNLRGRRGSGSKLLYDLFFEWTKKRSGKRLYWDFVLCLLFPGQTYLEKWVRDLGEAKPLSWVDHQRDNPCPVQHYCPHLGKCSLVLVALTMFSHILNQFIFGNNLCQPSIPSLVLLGLQKYLVLFQMCHL